MKPPPRDDAGAPARLRVVSYNVNFGLAGDRAGVEAVAALAPDLVFFQETNDAWRDALVAGLGARLPEHRFVPPPDMPAGGMGVMSRWPIALAEQLPAPTGGLFFAWRVVIDAPGGPIQVLDVHLRPPISDGGSWVVGYFSTKSVRANEAAVHAESLDRNLPTIVLGDFNEESDGGAVQLFVRRGFEDALAQYAPRTRTWQWKVGPTTLRRQLDHILYDSRFSAAAAGVAEAGRSDHFPVWVDLERLTR
jgi:endonuclease/exonuclease/phosphatase family metal-dependent hydrolase